jgi:5,10-methylene-tetrahydrofolate dehydrogenase/methenyl tetrahydrofolate cyclohydrolase
MTVTIIDGIAPGLATILVGDDPASEVYVRNKRRAATPVPGGVGPMTIAALLANTVSAAEAGTASTDQRFSHHVL